MKQNTTVSLWILWLSGIIAAIEIGVSVSLIIFPDSMGEKIDSSAIGFDFLMYMWASRQFALGAMFAFATYKKSAQMLFLSYVFLLVMFVGDLVTGIALGDSSLIIGGVLMSVISGLALYIIENDKLK